MALLTYNSKFRCQIHCCPQHGASALFSWSVQPSHNKYIHIYMDCLLWGQASKKTLNMYTCTCIHGLAPWGHTTLKMFQSPEDDGPVLDGSVENTQWPSGWEVVQLEYHVWYYMGVLSLRVKSLLESLNLLTTRSYPIPICNYEDTPGTIYSFVASDLVAARSRRPHCPALGSQRWRWSHVLRHRQSSGRI